MLDSPSNETNGTRLIAWTFRLEMMPHLLIVLSDQLRQTRHLDPFLRTLLDQCHL
jgi:hypothetical protein